MFKKTFFILIIISIFSLPNLLFGKIYINEVLLSPTEDRFIELYNDSSLNINLTGFYIQRKTQNGDFTSLISKTYFENKIIKGKSYFVISRNQNEISDIIYPKLTLTENNTIQLKNNKREVLHKLSWGNTEECKDNCYQNPKEGMSLQRIISNYVVSKPTIKSENKIEEETTKEEITEKEKYIFKIEDNYNNKELNIFLLIFILFIILISVLVYYLRNYDYKDEDEFEILDE